MKQDQDAAKSCVENHGNQATFPSNDIPPIPTIHKFPAGFKSKNVRVRGLQRFDINFLHLLNPSFVFSPHLNLLLFERLLNQGHKNEVV